jgi:hypothetical protein
MTAPTQADTGLTAAQMAELLILVKAQAAARKQLTDTAVAAVLAVFRPFDGWWNPTQITAAVKQALNVVQPAQRLAARTTDAYIARVVKTMTGRTVAGAGAVDVTKLRRTIPPDLAQAFLDGSARPGYLILGDTKAGPGPGIHDRMPLANTGDTFASPGTPYGRVADQFRYQVVAGGATEDAGRQKALVRLAVVAQTDITLAVREQYRRSLGKVNADAWRRVLHPELTKTGPCGLCVVAADREYHIEDLKPVHDRCVCEVLPILGGMDPGLTLNSDDLRAIYAAAGNTGGDVIKNGKRHSSALKRTRVALVEHGELGPVLVDADQAFRGPAQVAKTVAPDPLVRARAELDALDVSFGRLQRRKLAGEDVDRPLAWQENRIDQLRRQLVGAV